MTDELSAVAAKLKPGPGKSPVIVERHQRARLQRSMIEIAAERGCEAVTVREVARRAGVSTRTFYAHYSSKEECFLRSQRQASLRFVQGLEAVGVAIEGQEDAVPAVVGGIFNEWNRDLAGTRLLLVEASGFGGAAWGETRRVMRAIERLLEKAFVCPDEASLSGSSIGGMAAGIVGVARRSLMNEPGTPLDDLIGPLTQWVHGYQSSATMPSRFGGVVASSGTSLWSVSPLSDRDAGDEGVGALDGELNVFLSAATRLSERGERITPKKMALASGLSRRSFEDRFESVDDCLEALHRSRINEVMEEARRASGANAGVDTVRQAVIALCDRIARDRFFASLFLGEVVAPGEQRLSSQERLVEELRVVIKGATAPPGDGFVAEASACALYGVLQNEIAQGRASQLPEVAPMLASMLLTPLMGEGKVRSVTKSNQGGDSTS